MKVKVSKANTLRTEMHFMNQRMRELSNLVMGETFPRKLSSSIYLVKMKKKRSAS